MHPTQLVDTLDLLDLCLNDITSKSVSRLAVDLEGIDLSRNGTISLIQIISNSSTSVWVVDVFTLGAEAFSHTNPQGQSLKSVLEDSETMKIFWDVRNDSDALFSLYGINVEGVYDAQLLEVAYKRFKIGNAKFLKGLADAVITYVKPGVNWCQVKNAGKALLFPGNGGSYQLFEKRPLDPRILAYAANDTIFLFRLVDILEAGLGRTLVQWRKRVLKGSSERVADSHRAAYSPHGRSRCLAPIF